MSDHNCEECGADMRHCQCHVGCTRWVKLTPGANEIPLNKILMTWNGKSLSAPQVFRYRHMADQFRDEHHVKQFLIIPDPQT